MSNATIGEVVARQYDRVWDTLRDAVSKMSDQQWRTSDCDWLAPIRLAYHLVETAEFYTFSRPEDAPDAVGGDRGPVAQLETGGFTVLGGDLFDLGFQP